MAAKRLGVVYDRSITLGRQDLLLSSAEIQSLLNRAGIMCDEMEARRILTAERQFGEPLFRLMGAQVIDSMDCSSFEGATICHDLNRPLPDALKAKYTMVIDGGTLEHVFEFPNAVKCCMEMVEPGGHLLAITPSNNLMGHGFYQISPETYFRAFSKENGFVIEHMYLNLAFSRGDWLEVSDPAKVGQRVGLIDFRPTNVFVLARRFNTLPIFSSSPYQSDYSAEWNDKPNKHNDPNRLSFYQPPSERRTLPGRILDLMPAKIREHVRSYRAFRSVTMPPDPAMFRKITLEL